MWQRIKQWRWALLITAILLAGLAYALWPQPLLVDAAEVSRGPMAVSVTDDGVTRARDVYVVSAPVAGHLSRIELEAGDVVGKGALITRMTGPPSRPLDQRSIDETRAALAAARAAATGISASMVQSQRDLERAEELSKRGFLPRAQLEAARTEVATQKASLLQSRAEIARMRALMAEPTGSTSGSPVAVRAPASGEILSVIKESAGVIPEGTPLATIANPNSIEVVVDLLSREAVRVKPGDAVEISQWGGADPLVGEVKRIEPLGRLKVSALGIEEQRVNVIIVFAQNSLDQAIRLGHGYQVDATIQLWSEDNALRLPISALFRGPEGQWQTFIVENGQAITTEVELGRINDAYAQVLGGIEEGAQVIINPGSTVTDGTRVAAR